MKLPIIAGATIAIAAYFAVMTILVPSFYLDTYSIYPRPVHAVSISDETISLGGSVRIDIDITNNNDFAEYLITTVSFPNLTNAESHVQIVGYDFELTPLYVKAGQQAGSVYGTKLAAAPHALIESSTPNAAIEESYMISLMITPPEHGTFTVHVKSASLPHSDELAHFPYEGAKDAQGEFVSVYNIAVIP